MKNNKDETPEHKEWDGAQTNPDTEPNVNYCNPT